jgi:DNA repair exonuclease SbcCD nuclease subunit
MKQNVSKQPERAGDEEEPLLTFTPSVIPPQIQYCALGGIHKAQAVVKKPVPAIYAGNPYLVIPDMEKHNKYIAIIEITPQKPTSYRAIRLHTSKPMFSVDAHNFPEAAHKITEYPDALIYLTVLPERPLPVKECRAFLEEHPSVVALICPIDYRDETASTNVSEHTKEVPLSTNEIASSETSESIHIADEQVPEAESDIEQRPAEQQALLQDIISIPALQTDATALLREFYEQLFTEPASEELVFVFEELLLEKGAKD